MTERARIEQDEREGRRKGEPAFHSVAARPDGLTPASIAALQRSAGNRAVAGLMRQPAPPAGRSRQRVLKRTEVGERSRTVATIEVIGHASPRWRSAGNAEGADARNRALAESRAQQVGWEVELLLAELLPDRQLVFEHRYQTSTEEPDALNDPADVTLDATSRGSSETLVEAGARGRQANDDPMRRVEVRVTLRSATETQVDEDTEHTERKSGATKDWALSLQAEAGLEFGVKGGGVLVLLRNNLTDTVGTYAGGTFGGGLGAGFSLIKAQPTSFEPMWMPEEMTFADFDGAWFSIVSSGFGIGAFGYDASTFYFRSFPNGQATPDGVDAGGWSFGGVELNVGSVVSGNINLIDNPAEDYDLSFRMTHTQSYVSEAQEASQHRVLFPTGKHTLTETERGKLAAYLSGVSLGL